jgi:signal peptidase I
MIPTLRIGDYLGASKFAYGYSKHSIPFSPPLFSGRIWSADPKRGDVIVFKHPRLNDNYIKRLVGLPGDKIRVKNGVLYINGQEIKQEKIADFIGPASTCPPNSKSGIDIEWSERARREIHIERYRETFPNGNTHEILNCESQLPADNTGVFEVPQDHYFMMGDNRDNSVDSRFHPKLESPFLRAGKGVGFVPAENLIGRADFRFFSIRPGASLFAPWRWPWEIRWTRLVGIIR